MRLSKHLIAGLALAAATLPVQAAPKHAPTQQTAAAPTPTAADAAAFLHDIIARGTTNLSPLGDQGTATALGTEDCTSWISAKGRNDGVTSIQIHWDAVSEINRPYGNSTILVVHGQIKARANGWEIWDSLSFGFDSDTLATRAERAMRVLQKSCDTSNSHGF